MSYFDALASSAFKTTDDGRRFFFPWGTIGRGYAIGSDEEFRRLRRGVKVYVLVSFPLIGVVVAWTGILGAIAILPILIVPYVIWVRLQSKRLVQTNERLTLRESLANQARMHSAVGLWALEIVSVVFVLAGLYILVLAPKSWLVSLMVIGSFGLCALTFARMLVTKWRGGGLVER